MPSPAAPAPAAAPARGSHHAGFTLIELLVALSILAMLSLLGYRAVVSLTDAEVRLTAETAHWRALDTLFMRLEADLRQAQPRGVRGAAGVEPAWVVVPDRDGSAELRFSRAGPEFALEPASAGQRIGYRLRDGSVEVLYWPSLDAAPATEVRVLLPGEEAAYP